jgi:hypothetical protein
MLLIQREAQMSHSTKEVYAIWYLQGLYFDSVLESIGDLSISCGEGDHQNDGYFPEDPGSKFTIEPIIGNDHTRWKVTFTTPSCNLEKCSNYWLSPDIIGDVQTYSPDYTRQLHGEASEWGIREYIGPETLYKEL